MTTTAITNGKIFYRGHIIEADILIEDEKIKRIAKGVRADEAINAKGQLVLPGVIDVHVHFRDLEEAYKEDWYSGSCSAAAGGVTTVIDQPNTIPPTSDATSYNDKCAAARASVVDFGINACIENSEQAKKLCELGITAFGEIFTKNKTSDELLTVLRTIKELNALGCLHAERLHNGVPDEVTAIDGILRLNRKVGARLHMAHVSTHAGLELIKRTRQNVTCEVTPHHLFLSEVDAERLGPFGKMNPPLRSSATVEALWSDIDAIDMIASDHAPHSISDKRLPEPPPGVPGVETLVPLLLAHLHRLGLKRFVRLTNVNPAKRFMLKDKGPIVEGNDADLMVVDIKSKRIITAQKLHSKAGWTPFEGMEGVFPSLIVIRGNVVFDGDIVAEKGSGRQVVGPGQR
jgi:dihydroorotase